MNITTFLTSNNYRNMGNFFRKAFENKVYKILIIGIDMSGKSTLIYKFKIGDIFDIAHASTYHPDNPCEEGQSMKNYEFYTMNLDQNDERLYKFREDQLRSADAFIFLIDASDTQYFENGELRRYLQTLSHFSYLEYEDMKNNSKQPNIMKHKVFTDYDKKHPPKPLLIFANKQDLNYAMTPEKVGMELELYKCVDYISLLMSKDATQRTLLTDECPMIIIQCIVEYMPKQMKPFNEKKALFKIQGSSATTGDGIYEGLDWLARKIKR